MVSPELTPWSSGTGGHQRTGAPSPPSLGTPATRRGTAVQCGRIGRPAPHSGRATHAHNPALAGTQQGWPAPSECAHVVSRRPLSAIQRLANPQHMQPPPRAPRERTPHRVTRMWSSARMRAHTCVCAPARAHTYPHAPSLVHTQAHPHACAQTRAHVCAHTHAMAPLCRARTRRKRNRPHPACEGWACQP